MLVIKKTKPDFNLKRAFILFSMEPAAATQRVNLLANWHRCVYPASSLLIPLQPR